MRDAALVVFLWAASASAQTPTRFEFVLYPAPAQVNGKFSQHYGTAAAVLWRPTRVFAIHITGQYNWYASDSAFNTELADRTRSSAKAATALQWVWGALAGFEMEPLDGEAMLGSRGQTSLSLLVNGGIGLGGTRIELIHSSRLVTYGDTGVRVLGSLGGGLKLELGRLFALRVELRDVFFSGRVDRVNGCTADQLFQGSFFAPSGSPADAACAAGGFSSDPEAADDMTIARQRILESSSDVVHVVGLYLGLALRIP